MTKRVCSNGDFIVQGRYYLFNNLWGAATGEGRQCVWRTSDNDLNIAWRTDWNWSGPDDTIKSYVAVVLGWHWGWRLADTGLPVQLSSIQSAPVFWNFDISHKTPGGTNVTYDIWLSSNPQHNAEDPSAEIMIWLYKPAMSAQSVPGEPVPSSMKPAGSYGKAPILYQAGPCTLS